MSQREPPDYSRRQYRLAKLLVAIAGGALAVGLLTARATPPRGYEVSIYAATPELFWVGAVAALLVALVVPVWCEGLPLRWGAGAVGTLAVVAIVGLPLVRGYYYYGGADAMTHLGWAKELATGVTAPTEVFYPGIHTVATMLHGIAGMPVRRSLLFVVVLATLVFVVFVGLLVRSFADRPPVAAVGVASAFMLLPLNNVATELHPHPISQASLLSALLLFLLVRYLGTDRGEGRLGVTPTGVALGIVTVGLVLYHPQEAMVVLVLFGTITLAQRLARRRDVRGRLRPLGWQTALLGGVFLLWVTQHQAFYSQVQGFFFQLATLFSGGEVAGVVTQRGTSLSQVGSGYVEIFLKLFAGQAVYAALTGLLLLGVLTGRVQQWFDAERHRTLQYLALAMVALALFSAVHLAGGLSKLVFRYLATMMVLATALGAVVLGRYLVGEGAGRLGKTVIVGVVALLVVAGVAAAFPSPYIYQASSQRTEAGFAGYDAAFEYADEDAELAGVRQAIYRYRHAISGPSSSPWRGRSVPPEMFPDRVPAFFEATGYLMLSDIDEQREVVAYRGLRYQRDEFVAIALQRDVSRLQDTGSTQLYLVEGG
jgi:hypothetical protein